jgi:hypothetical protein
VWLKKDENQQLEGSSTASFGSTFTVSYIFCPSLLHSGMFSPRQTQSAGAAAWAQQLVTI